MIEIGCFVSSHGFGHAARMTAVLEALAGRADILPRIFTTAEENIFTQTLSRYDYNHLLTDIGFIQSDAFQIDITATCARLSSLLPYDDEMIDRLAETCRNCSLILCDISGMGVKVAARANIPSVLIENFTWEWLYRSFEQEHPEIRSFRRYLAGTFSEADYHIQTEPLCFRQPSDLHCGPIFRTVRSDPGAIRKKLGCGERRLVLVTLGGFGFTPDFLGDLQKYDSFFFLFSGQQRERKIGENVRLLGRFSDYYHPDLILSADTVVFKSGYSTLAECYQCGTPAFCIQRPGFSESEILERFAVEKMGARLLRQEEFYSGKWLAELSANPPLPSPPAKCNGADIVADFLFARLG